MSNPGIDHVNVSVCRFCLCKPEPDGHKLIFTSSKCSKLAIVRNVIEKVMKIKIDNHTTKSRIICSTCEEKLQTFQLFYDQIQTNEEIWKQCKIQSIKDAASVIEEIEPEIVFKQEDVESFGEVYQDFIVEIDAFQPRSHTKQDEQNVEPVDESKKRRNTQTDPETDRQLCEFYNFSCKICGDREKFETFADYKRHAREEHDDKDAFIRCCGSKLSKRYNLVEHMAYHTRSKQLKCPICEKFYTKRDILNFHIKQMHGTDEDKPYQCDICSKRYVRLESLAIHVKVHMSKEEREKFRIHKCDQCDAVFSTKHNVKNHKKYKHQGEYAYFCAGCAKYFKSRLDYEIHRRNVHDDDGPDRAQCHICSRWFSHEKALRNHIRDTHNPGTPFVCIHCNHQTKSRQALRSHIKMKHEERKYRCDYCEKAFQTPRRLNEHLTVHVGGTLYSCGFCEKTFNSNSNMYKHLKAMHPEDWMREKTMKANNPKYVGVSMGTMAVKPGIGTS